ncbi:MFS transporter [Larkinella arboricola]
MQSTTIPPQTKPSARAWLFVAMLGVVGCLNYLDRIMITTMRGSILESIPMSDARFGLLTAVFLWVYGLLSPFAGFLADRFNRSRVIIGSLFIWSVVTWLTARATSFEELLLTRALMGISEACYIPAALALIADYHRGSTRSLATGIHMAGVIAGQSLGFVGGWIAEKHRWNAAFEVFGLFGIGYALVLLLVLRDAPKPQTDFTTEIAASPESPVSFWRGIGSLFSQKAFVLTLTYWGLLGVVGWLIIGWLPTFYREHFQLSQTTAGLYATGYLYTAGLVGVLVGGAWADRWSRTNPRARMLVPALGLVVAAPAVFFASSTASVAVAIAGFMVYSFTRSFSDANMMPILCLVSDPRYRATGYGVLNLFSCIVGGIGLYAGGILRDANVNLTILFYVAAVIMLLCAYFLLMVKPAKTDEIG